MRRICALWRRVLACGCAAVMLSNAALALPMLNAAQPVSAVQSVSSALDSIQAQAEYLGDDLSTPEGERLLTLYAGNVIPYIGGTPEWVDGPELTVDAERVNALLERISGGIPAIAEEVDGILSAKGVEAPGPLPVMVLFKMSQNDIRLTISHSVTEVEGVDVIQVKAPAYEVSFRPADLAADLDGDLVIILRDHGENLTTPLIEVAFQDESLESLAGYITLSLPKGEGNLNEMAIMDPSFDLKDPTVAFPTGYNEATRRMDGSVKRPGVYRLTENGKQFNDLEGVSSEREQAIYQLFAANIVQGFSDGGFHPKDYVTRAQFVKIIMNAVGKIDHSLKSPFPDIAPGAFYYYHAATAAKLSYMNGYKEGHFGGGTTLTRAHICAVVGRILQKERAYTVPDEEDYLRQYRDSVDAFARTQVALLLKLGVIDSHSGYFHGSEPVSRGEIAEIVCRMLKRLK